MSDVTLLDYSHAGLDQWSRTWVGEVSNDPEDPKFPNGRVARIETNGETHPFCYPHGFFEDDYDGPDPYPVTSVEGGRTA